VASRQVRDAAAMPRSSSTARSSRPRRAAGLAPGARRGDGPQLVHRGDVEPGTSSRCPRVRYESPAVSEVDRGLVGGDAE
jgi:hypothetical protein